MREWKHDFRSFGWATQGQSEPCPKDSLALSWLYSLGHCCAKVNHRPKSPSVLSVCLCCWEAPCIIMLLLLGVELFTKLRFQLISWFWGHGLRFSMFLVHFNMLLIYLANKVNNCCLKNLAREHKKQTLHCQTLIKTLIKRTGFLISVNKKVQHCYFYIKMATL